MLKLENGELRSRLDSNSKNSHLPPSKDLFKSKPAFPKSGTGKQGGKEGHTLYQSLSPDVVVNLGLPSVCSCGCNLSGVSVVKEVKRQVFDIPDPKLRVTEYVQRQAKCPGCGKGVRVEFPQGVTNHVQYGNSVLAFCALLSNGCHLSCEQISQLFSDLFGQPLNPATVIAANERCYDRLAPSEAVIKAELLRSKVVHFDESGLAVAGKTYWLHVASTDLLTHLFVHEKRGKEALQSEPSLLPNFKHFAVHDCWASYFNLEHIQHAVCNAHILRELEALVEKEGQWAAKMKELLLELYQLSQEGTAIVPDLAPYLLRYKQICREVD
ncbi:MAG: IS66 family transposase [Sphingobacteriales bacterium]|nr:IS66 family transposase [Sphingobacteriales bacterium]